MREDYKLKGSTSPMQFELEQRTAEILKQMETYTKLSVSELANTALKRFIAAHNDFLPPQSKK